MTTNREKKMKIATWNVNSLTVRLAHVLDWCQEHQPDILALQETKTPDEKFPQAEIEEAGYQVAFSGQKTYNGVAILSKQKAEDIVTDVADLDDPQRRILAASINDIRIINLYIPNGQSLDSDKFIYKMDWLEKVTAFIQTEMSKHEKLVVLGDFNIAPEDVDVHDPNAWEGHVHVSSTEREVFQQWIELGLVDTFRQFPQEPKLYSWWDYRQLAFRRNRGLRIDHILATSALSASCKQAYIDKAPRKLERPSDHTVIVSEF